MKKYISSIKTKADNHQIALYTIAFLGIMIAIYIAFLFGLFDGNGGFTYAEY